MRKITNTEENNQYYKLINTYIGEYIHDNRISPKSLKNYFKNNSKLETFLKRYQLDDVDGIKRVFNDVVDDWYYLQADGVMTFEKFSRVNEDLGKIELQKSDIEYEKILADLYHTSVGHVDKVDMKEHKFTVKDFGKEVDVIVYSKKDVEDFKSSILSILLSEANTKTLEFFKVDVGLKSGKEVKTSISFPISEVISEDKLKESLSKKLSEEKLLQVIYNFINDYDVLSGGRYHYNYKEEYKGYHVWELMVKK